MNVDQSDRLLTASQAGEFLGVSEQTLAIWRCNKRYDLKYVKIGRKVRYRFRDLMMFVESRTVGAESTGSEETS